MPDKRIVIVGAGQAGVQVAESLRSGGFDGAITLLGDEPHAPYHRPPLSKAWLTGEMAAAQGLIRAPEALARKQIEFRAGTRVQRIDRAARTVELEGGGQLSYTGLAFATGASARRLPLAHADAPNVHVLRTRDHAGELAVALQDCAARGLPMVVIGGGFIGLEMAATARKQGVAVTVLEAQPRLLARVMPPMLSDWFADLHRAQGVQLRTGVQIDTLLADAGGRVTGARLADGELVPLGAVLLGVGAQPNDALARAAGLECDRGIIVDDCGRTADPAIVAAGDCTVRRRPDGTLLRLESVQGASEGAKAAAAALLGMHKPFTATPWFWSDQFGRKLQMAGLATGASRSVLRGSLQAPSFSVWHYAGERLLAVDSIDAAREHLLARKLLDAGVWPTPAQAADTGFDPATLLAR